MSSRAFTLFQVVVVSVIVAVSAAVLVPTVSAQGGPKGDAKSWHITQLKSLGLAFAAYSSDWDDCMPQAYFKRPETPTSQWGIGMAVPSPADVVNLDPWNTPLRIAASQTVWRNSVAVYSGSTSTILPGAPSFTLTGEIFNGVPNLTNPIMNGLLHSFSVNAVNNPSIVPMLWPGAGLLNLRGRFFSNPALGCGTTPTCRFNPTGPPSSNTVGFDGTMYIYASQISTWIFGQSGPVVRVDTSVALKPMGSRISPLIYSQSEATVDPWASVSTTGVPVSYLPCGPGHTAATPNPGVDGQGRYPCYFRPDRTE